MFILDLYFGVKEPLKQRFLVQNFVKNCLFSDKYFPSIGKEEFDGLYELNINLKINCSIF
jgi:hypothetical protein